MYGKIESGWQEKDGGAVQRGYVLWTTALVKNEIADHFLFFFAAHPVELRRLIRLSRSVTQVSKHRMASDISDGGTPDQPQG